MKHINISICLIVTAMAAFLINGCNKRDNFQYNDTQTPLTLGANNDISRALIQAFTAPENVHFDNNEPIMMNITNGKVTSIRPFALNNKIAISTPQRLMTNSTETNNNKWVKWGKVCGIVSANKFKNFLEEKYGNNCVETKFDPTDADNCRTVYHRACK